MRTAGNGGVPARRAVIRWAWRLFRREWRQQLLVLALIVVAVAATIVGAAVATNTPPPGQRRVRHRPGHRHLPGARPAPGRQIAALRHRFGPVDVIENQTLTIPGSIDTYDLRAQNPHGAFGQPMLVAGHRALPRGPGQVAVTNGVASVLKPPVGDLWHQGGTSRRVVGIVENPQSLLDEFALVVPGQVSVADPGHGPVRRPRSEPASLGPNVQTRSSVVIGQRVQPRDHRARLATVGMLLIALVAVGGFTVLAQRRLRSLGMLGALGRHRQEHPAGRAGQRRRRRRRRRGGRRRPGPGGLAGLPTAPAIERPPRDRRVRSCRGS